MEQEWLSVEVDSPSDGTAVVSVVGEVDIATAPKLADVLDRLTDDGCRHIAVDLAGVTFMDCSGLSVLVRALKRLDRKGGGVLTCSRPRPSVRKTMEITGLALVLLVGDDPSRSDGSTAS